MKKITLLLLALFVSIGVSAQCDFDGNQYPSTPATATNDGFSHNISTCNYFGEYSVLTGMTVGEEYQFTADGGHVTIIDNADGVTVLDFGPSPINWTATVAEVELHWAVDSGCGADSACHTTTYLNVTQAPSCGEPSGLAATPGETTADISWSAPGSGTPIGYNWEIQPDLVAQGTPGGITGNVATTMDTATGLTAETAYDLFVQTDCDTDGTSTWAGPYSFTTTATPPANDDFANAIAVFCGDSLTGSTSDATLDEDDAPDGFGADLDAPNVWYSFTGTGSPEEVTVSLCATTTYDSAFLVYTGTSGNLTIVGGNDDFCGLQSEAVFVSDGTTTYYITVEGWNSSSTGDFSLDISCVPAATPPANDDCANAEALVFATPTAGTTVAATQNGADDQPSCDTFGVIADVWYSVEVTEVPSDLTINTTVTAPGDAAHIAIYSDCTLATELGCSDAGDPESLTVQVYETGTYLVRVWSDGSPAPPSSNRALIEGDFTVTADAVLAVENNEFTGFRYFPNPVEGTLSLRAQNNIEQVAVYNMLGQEVINVSPNTMSNDLDMSTLSSGAYFVKVNINGAVENFKIIKE